MDTSRKISLDAGSLYTNKVNICKIINLGSKHVSTMEDEIKTWMKEQGRERRFSG
jgi:hypothetical protein